MYSMFRLNAASASALMRASNPPYFGKHSRDLRSVERFISIWLASKVICRCRMAVWTGTFPLNPLPLIKVVHDERRDCDRRAGQLHRRGDDSGKRGHGEGGDRYDVHEQHANRNEMSARETNDRLRY
jgi:hypothetical protein